MDTTTPLLGLLSIHWDATFHGATGLPHDHRPWLVLHLDLVRAPTPTAFVRAVHAALDAFTSLCARLNQEQEPTEAAVAIWTSVIGSSRMRASEGGEWEPHDVVATRVARSVDAHGLAVALSWEHRPFQTTVVAAIRAFLHARSAGPDVRVGLRIAQCGITASGLRQLAAVFQRPPTTPQEANAPTLDRLDLSDNALTSAELHAIADLLENAVASSSLCLRELVLDGTLSDTGGDDEPESIAAFTRLLAAALTAPVGVDDPHGFSLSLARNTLHEAHFASLHDVLAQTHRTIDHLTLERAIISPDGWQRLARLVCSSVSSMRNCDLNISELRNTSELMPSFLAGLTTLVRESLPRMHDALATETRVQCRVFNPVVVPLPASLKEARKARNKIQATPPPRPDLTVYDVVAVDKSHQRLQLRRGSSVEWINIDSVAWLVIDDQPIVHACIGGLVVDSRVEHNANVYCTALTIERLLPLVGPTLRRLRLRGEADTDTSPASIVQWCPQLQVLDVSAWGRYRPKWLWRDLAPTLFRALETVCVSWWDVRERDIANIQAWLAAGAGHTLRTLWLSCYKISADALDVLEEIRRDYPSLRIVRIE